jgi:hypothetical protein
MQALTERPSAVAVTQGYGTVFNMVKAEHLRLAAKRSLARAVRTEEPEVVERLICRAENILTKRLPLKWPRRGALEAIRA